jgi:hypothetical protein
VAKFSVGDRVSIHNSFEWGTGGSGIIQYPPSLVTERTGEWVDGVARFEQGPHGFHLVFWVEFDRPLHDLTEDGPYLAGSVEEEALRLIPNQ